MLRGLKCVLAAVAATALLWTTANAQDSPVRAGFGVGGTVGYFSLSGDDFEDTDAGIGFEAFGRYSLPSGFQVSAGVHYGTHDVDYADSNLGVLGVFVNPRYVFEIASPTVAPFIGGLASYVRKSISEDGVDASGNGFAFGGSGGLIIQVAPQVAIETSVMFAAISFGDWEVDGDTLEGSDTSGSTLALQAGVVVSLSR